MGRATSLPASGVTSLGSESSEGPPGVRDWARTWSSVRRGQGKARRVDRRRKVRFRARAARAKQSPRLVRPGGSAERAEIGRALRPTEAAAARAGGGRGDAALREATEEGKRRQGA